MRGDKYIRAVEVEGLHDFLRMVSKADKELSKELRKAAIAVAKPVATDASRRARGSNKQLSRVASTYKAKSDRIPVVSAGGSSRVVASGGATSGDLVFGSEFGSNNYKQFPPRVASGRAIYPALEAARQLIEEEYVDAVRRVFRG